jgi:multidrug efflux pump subunit AcrA (membrane-fusion protein)
LWTVGAALVGAVAAVVLVVSFASRPAPVAAATTTTVARGTVTVQVSAAGTVQAAQSRGLSFSTTGTVTEVDMKAGDAVKVGQVLAKIDPTDAQAAVDAAESRVSDASDALDRAEADAALPACPSASSGSSRGGAGPAAAAATPTCTTAGRSQSSSDPVLSAQQQLNSANLTLEQARRTLAGTTIAAPVAGRVLSVAGKVGSTASPGGTGFVVLGDLSTLGITAQFSEADVTRLAVGQTVSIALADRDTPLPGKVSQVDPAGTVSGQLVQYGVVVVFDQVPADLLLGESGTVTVTTASATDVLYVSSAAVTGVSGGSGTVVVRSATGEETRTVQVGLRGDQYTEITGGLAEGDVLVLPSAG